MNFWLGCLVGYVFVMLTWLVVFALCHVSAAADERTERTHEHEPLVTVVDGGTVIGRAEILHRKGKYLTVQYEGGQVGVIDSDHVEVIEGVE